MKFNRKVWLDSKKKKPCPSCESGLLLSPNKNHILKNETRHSKEINAYGGDYTEYIFSIHLKCSNCNEFVAVTGKIAKENYPIDEDIGLQETVIISSYLPPPKIISIPKSCPKSVSKVLNESFGLYWLDISSCANKIRISIEVLMDKLNVNK